MANKKIRKDVLIYRIVFACMCVALLLLVTAIVVTIVNKNKEKSNSMKPTTQQTQVKPSESSDQPTSDTNNSESQKEPQTQQEPQSQQESQKPSETQKPSEDQPSGDDQPSNEPSGFVEGAKATSKGQLNIRKEPNTDCEVIGGVDRGGTVVVVADEGDWVKITYNDVTGYVMKKYLELQ